MCNECFHILLESCNFLDRAQLQTQNLSNQECLQTFLAPRMKSPDQTFYGRGHGQVNRYEISFLKWQ